MQSMMNIMTIGNPLTHALVTLVLIISYLSPATDSRITIPESTIRELVNKACKQKQVSLERRQAFFLYYEISTFLFLSLVVETIAQKQRDLLDTEWELMMTEQDPEVQPGFYEGDMAGVDTDGLSRLGINFNTFPDRQWPNQTVPYIISPLYLPDEFVIIQTALRVLSFYTCINFREWDGKERDYLVIWPVEKPAGCWSYVGRLGGPQIVSLQQPDFKSPQCFSGIGRPLHEIMHALGVFHEQSRPDRDKYVTIVKPNVVKGFLNNFDKLHPKNVSAPFAYDYKSIMHYGTNFFSKNRKNSTVVPKQKIRGSGKPVPIGQRINLSKLDCLKLNSLYGCLDERFPVRKRKYKTFCDFLGL